MPMHIAILTTGRINPQLEGRYGPYYDMFVNMLTTYKDTDDTIEFQFTNFLVLDGQFPASIHDFDGYIITGSPSAVYKEYHWLDSLFTFIKDCHKAQIPLCGICFGHQAVARALGGHVINWPEGWGVGIHKMTLKHRPVWMQEDIKEFSLIYIHEDQVTDLPEHARTFASNAFCAHGGFFIGEHIFCLQGHPEFAVKFTCETIDARRKDIGEAKTRDALQSLTTKTPDTHIATNWIRQFFVHACRTKTH